MPFNPPSKGQANEIACANPATTKSTVAPIVNGHRCGRNSLSRIR
jgi:hypothetical protein